MKLYLIRHGSTKGNIEKRYVGNTDEELLEESKHKLKIFVDNIQNVIVCPVKKVYVSPMLRCRQTADILFPVAEQIVVEELRECNFGEFEYKNYIDLNGREDYQRFIDTNGKTGFPGGEEMKEFKDRCAEGFMKVLEQNEDVVVMVVHGGTIMSILDRYSSPHKDYYDWQIGNGSGYKALVEKDMELRICRIELL